MTFHKKKVLAKTTNHTVALMAPNVSGSYSHPPIVVKSTNNRDLSVTFSDKANKNEYTQLLADRYKKLDEDFYVEANINKTIHGLGEFYRSSNILRYKKVSDSQGTFNPPTSYVAMKYIEGVTAHNFEITAPRHFIDIAIASLEALKKIHANHYVHGDLHDENMMINETSSGKFAVTLIDFTLTRKEGDSINAEALALNMALHPPEYAITPSYIRYRYNQDIYRLSQNILKQKFNSVWFDDITAAQVSNILKQMTLEQPNNRPSIDELIVKFKTIKISDKKNLEGFLQHQTHQFIRHLDYQKMQQWCYYQNLLLHNNCHVINFWKLIPANPANCIDTYIKNHLKNMNSLLDEIAKLPKESRYLWLRYLQEQDKTLLARLCDTPDKFFALTSFLPADDRRYVYSLLWEAHTISPEQKRRFHGVLKYGINSRAQLCLLLREGFDVSEAACVIKIFGKEYIEQLEEIPFANIDNIVFFKEAMDIAFSTSAAKRFADKELSNYHLAKSNQRILNTYKSLHEESANLYLDSLIKTAITEKGDFRKGIDALSKYKNTPVLYQKLLEQATKVYQYLRTQKSSEKTLSQRLRHSSIFRFFGYSEKDKLIAAQQLQQSMAKGEIGDLHGALNNGDLGYLAQTMSRACKK